MANDIIMKAAALDAQSAKWRAGRTLEGLAATHWLQPKYDGCHLIVDTGDGHSVTAGAMSRTGERVRSVDHIVAEATRRLGPGWVVQGEAWLERTPFNVISGEYRAHAPRAWLHMVTYDLHPRGEFYARADPTPYRDRYTLLMKKLWRLPGEFMAPPLNYFPGNYGDPAEAARSWVAMGGCDGAILVDPDATWSAGPSRAGELIKVKPNISLDLRVGAVMRDVGPKTGRDVFTIVVEYAGVMTVVGSGIPHDVDKVPKPGQIVEIEAMGFTKSGALREPRFKAIRYDKLVADGEQQ